MLAFLLWRMLALLGAAAGVAAAGWLLTGQPSLALELHYCCPPRSQAQAQAPMPCAWLAVCCPAGCEAMVEAALRNAYPNCRVGAAEVQAGAAGVLLRLKKAAPFIR